jgi:hypothetical protein
MHFLLPWLLQEKPLHNSKNLDDFRNAKPIIDIPACSYESSTGLVIFATSILLVKYGNALKTISISLNCCLFTYPFDRFLLRVFLYR